MRSALDPLYASCLAILPRNCAKCSAKCETSMQHITQSSEEHWKLDRARSPVHARSTSQCESGALQSSAVCRLVAVSWPAT